LSSLWWWPFWWLAIIAGLFLLSGVTWVVLSTTTAGTKPSPVAKPIHREPLQRPSEKSPRQGTVAAALAAVENLKRAMDEHEAAQQPKVIVDYTVLEQMWGHDFYAQLRRDGRWWVFLNQNQSRDVDAIGWLIHEPSDDTWESRNLRDRHIGWYKSQTDALRGLRESLG
ncbi:MAG: hypothetical protein JWO18_2909, partial [Microbacteriaceae bacterium]|nr:hypothetical protein [Microbacteriaceae bacterium]